MFQKSLIDRYQHRPQALSFMYLAEFAATYVVKYEHNDCDALPAPENDVTSAQITLTDNFGKINKRKQQAVIRFRKYNEETGPSNWYGAKLMLYSPWFDEETHLLGRYATYEEHYRHVKTIVQTNESKYTKADIDDIQVHEDGPPEHLWSSIAPSTEESRMQSMAEGSEQLTEVSQQDLRDNESILTSGPNFHVGFECCQPTRNPPDQYREST